MSDRPFSGLRLTATPPANPQTVSMRRLLHMTMVELHALHHDEPVTAPGPDVPSVEQVRAWLEDGAVLGRYVVPFDAAVRKHFALVLGKAWRLVSYTYSYWPVDHNFTFFLDLEHAEVRTVEGDAEGQ